MPQLIHSFNFELFSLSLEKMQYYTMTMVDKCLVTEMFELNALSQVSIALFMYHGGWPCDLC